VDLLTSIGRKRGAWKGERRETRVVKGAEGGREAPRGKGTKAVESV